LAYILFVLVIYCGITRAKVNSLKNERIFVSKVLFP
jgi:hypothetical protein